MLHLPYHQSIPNKWRLVIFAALLFAVAAPSCKDDPIEPEDIGGSTFGCLFSELNKPEETGGTVTLLRAFGQNPEVTASVRGGLWLRPAGIATFDIGSISPFELAFTEPTFTVTSGECRMSVVGLSVVLHPDGVDTPYKLDPDSLAMGRTYVSVRYLSDDAISAEGILPVVPVNGPRELSFVEVDFDLVQNICSPTAGPPASSRYKITLGDGTAFTDSIDGTTTKWDENIGVIVCGPTVIGETEHGLNLRVVRPLRNVNGKCVMTLASAQFTIVNNAVSPPDVRVYLFPTESGENTTYNNRVTVDFYSDVKISGETLIPMQRNDIVVGWLEPISIKLDFDAFEPGYTGP